MSDFEKAREFWIQRFCDDYGNCHDDVQLTPFPGKGDGGYIHVIEYSAYQALKAENERLRSALSKVEQAIQDSSGFDRHLYVENNEIRVDFDSFATATVEDCSAGYITLREIQEALKEYRGEE